jgi:hypothetical protein
VSWNHLEDTHPVARKAHRCYLCGREIAVGERHVRRTGVGEDGLWTGRMHEECEALTVGWTEDDWECHDPAEFRDDVLESRED